MNNHYRPTPLGHRVRQARNTLGLSVHKLGELAGVSDDVVHRVENGTSNGSLKTLKRLGKTLGISFGELYRLSAPYRHDRETELPDLEGFLYVKHRGLHADDIAALQAHLDELLDQRTRRKGGEDEHTDPTP